MTLKQSLSYDQKAATDAIRDVTRQACIRVTINENNAQTVGGVPFTETGRVTRLYEADGGRYYGIVQTQRVIDNIYYNVNSRHIVCGQRDWEGFANSGEIRFREVVQLPNRSSDFS